MLSRLVGHLKKAFSVDMIKDGEAWVELLRDRNLTVHTYDEAKALQVDALIRE